MKFITLSTLFAHFNAFLNCLQYANNNQRHFHYSLAIKWKAKVEIDSCAMMRSVDLSAVGRSEQCQRVNKSQQLTAK